MNEAKQQPRLQQLLLKTLRPNRLNQSDSQISERTAPPSSDSQDSPEYTELYSGFFLDGILTVRITPAEPFVFYFELELLDSTVGGTVSLVESKMRELICEGAGPAGVVTKVLESIQEYYLSLLVEENKNEPRH